MQPVYTQIALASDEAAHIVWKARQGMSISPKSGSSSSFARLGKDLDRVYSQNTASEEEDERIPDVCLSGWVGHRGN